MANGPRQSRIGQAIAAEESQRAGSAGRQALESVLAQASDVTGQQQAAPRRQRAAPAPGGRQPTAGRSPQRFAPAPGGGQEQGQNGGIVSEGVDLVSELASRAERMQQQQRPRPGEPNADRRQRQHQQGLGPVEGPEDTLSRRLRRMEAVRIGQTQPGRAFLEETARSFVDNMMQTPQVIGNLLAAGSAGIRSMWGVGADLAEGGLTEAGRGIGQRFSEALPEEQQRLPARAFRELSEQAPDSAEIMGGVAAGAQAVSGEGGQSAEEMTQTFRDRRLQQRQEQPVATELGGATADALSVLGMRQPFVRGPRRQAMREFKQPGSAVPPNPTTDMPPGVRRQVRQMMESDLSTALRTGAKQTGSAGLEGSIVALLNDGDPAQMAGFAAGAEATRNMLTSGAKHIIRSPAGVGGALITGTALWQMMKEGTPGGNDYILESFETSAEKMLGTLALGGLSLAVGGAKPSRKLQENIPVLADAINSVPRNVVNSLANSLLSYEEPPSADVDAAFQAFVRNPNTFGQTARRRLERSFQSDKTDPRAEIEHLLDNSESFRQTVSELRSPDQPEP